MHKALTGMMTTMAIAIGLSLASPAQARPCVVGTEDYTIESGRTFELDQPEPAWIDGEEAGSRVNIRSGPGLEHESTGYGLVRNYIDIIGQGMSESCETWAKVRFPISGHEGWIHGQFIGATYPRGWWD